MHDNNDDYFKINKEMNCLKFTKVEVKKENFIKIIKQLPRLV